MLFGKYLVGVTCYGVRGHGTFWARCNVGLALIEVPLGGVKAAPGAGGDK